MSDIQEQLEDIRLRQKYIELKIKQRLYKEKGIDVGIRVILSNGTELK